MKRVYSLVFVFCLVATRPLSSLAEKIVTLKSEGKTFEVESVYKAGDVVWGFDFIDKDTLVFTERSGAMWKLDLPSRKAQAITGLPKIKVKGQGGLLDVAYHSDSKQIYFTYSKENESGSTTALASAVLASTELKNLKVIFEAVAASDTGHHFGSRIAFKNEFVFIGIGDRGQREQSQSLQNHQGTIVRLGLQGQVPSDNPFVDKAHALPEIWSFGHRNPQGLALRPGGNELWEAEFGPRGGDELNIIEKGKNYGWPVITYGREYYGPRIGTTHKAGMEQPLRYYTPSISPSGIAFYDREKLKEWKGDLFIANLSSQHLRRIKLKGRTILKEEELLSDQNWRFRHVRTGPDGKLYFSTDSGLIARIDYAKGA